MRRRRKGRQSGGRREIFKGEACRIFGAAVGQDSYMIEWFIARWKIDTVL